MSVQAPCRICGDTRRLASAACLTCVSAAFGRMAAVAQILAPAKRAQCIQLDNGRKP